MPVINSIASVSAGASPLGLQNSPIAANLRSLWPSSEKELSRPRHPESEFVLTSSSLTQDISLPNWTTFPGDRPDGLVGSGLFGQRSEDPGGTEGMLDDLLLLPGGDIIVSEEAATYRPKWSGWRSRLNESHSTLGHWRVVDTSPRADWQSEVYRFFELYDLANVRCARQLCEGTRR